MDFNGLKRNLKRDFSGFKKIKVALLGDTATQFLAQALRGHGYQVSIDLELYEADYNQIDAQLLDKTSELYRWAPRVVIVFHSYEHLARKFYRLSTTEKRSFAENHLQQVKNLCRSVSAELPGAKIIYFNFAEEDDGVFGNYANKVVSSLLWQIRELNLGLMKLARDTENLFICDLCSLQSRLGSMQMCDSRFHINADMPISLEALPALAAQTVDIILAIEGRIKKALVLDLDNTLWGGVIGDDGLAGIQIGDLGVGKAFTELQLWAQQLKQRGILLAVCSKNEESTAMEPFRSHPDMVLRLDDFAMFVANWNTKVDNIRHIQKVLNIGMDSLVFLDDNPVERDIVRQHVPGICVPELPSDPAEYVPYLRGLNLFETASYTEEDAQRTRQYQEEAQRSQFLTTFTDEDSYLASLEMLCRVERFNEFSLPRVAQLTQRSNQFNLRTVRYTEDELRTIGANPDYLTFSFSLRDRFGDNGLISVVILKTEPTGMFIDTWLMSCRVLKRGMEQFVLNEITLAAKNAGASALIGQYVPTPKNKMVKDHYSSLGFQADGERWRQDIASYRPRTNHIKKEES